MKLIGKAKELFEEWLKVHPFLGSDKYEREYFEVNVDGTLIGFENVPDSMQWGVYQDWADSLGWLIGVEPCRGGQKFYAQITEKGNLLIWDNEFTSRDEARIQVIEKLNEIINTL